MITRETTPDLSFNEIRQAVQDFRRCISPVIEQAKRYVLIDLEFHTQQILPDHAVETAIRDLKPFKGAVNCWVCEEYIVIEQDLPKEQ